LRDHREEIAISVITRAEVLTGFDGERGRSCGASAWVGINLPGRDEPGRDASARVVTTRI
jgi:hypothetical protein